MPKTPDGRPAGPPDPASPAGAQSAQSDNGERRPDPHASTQSRGADTIGAGAAAGPGAPSTAATAGSRPGHTISERKKQFLVASRQPHESLQALGFQPLQFSAIEQALRSNPEIEVLGTVGPSNGVGAFAAGMGGTHGVLVARMTEQKANLLYQQGQGRVLVERDQHLTMLEPAFRAPGMVTGMIPAAGTALETVIQVIGKDGAPVADAEVSLFGSLLPATAVTDANGQATLKLFGETVHTISGLYVKAKSDYWSFYQRDPDISSSEPNVVGLRLLSDWPALANFPQQKALGWGQKVMRLDQLPGNYRGQGIKIAVIDSGAATTHQNLARVGAGFDILHKTTTPETWNQDALGHGSHCTAVIAGADIATGLRGFAPDAEIHACKLFPGGQVSQLIDALEYCIEKQVDVVNLSLGGAEPSEALEQQIVRAKQAGIACIVAAGNSGGAVQYPASSAHVLAVAAIGKLGEFPPDSYHAETLTQGVDANGYYPASFSCHGPQVAVCAPGVAITSAVPPNNFAAWDGTSMAAPHITGLAALVLAHHPDFQTAFKARGAARVERLFQIIKMSARSVSLGDHEHTGFGLPDVLVAVGLQTASGQTIAQQASAPVAAFAALMGNPGVAQPLAAQAAQMGASTHGPQFGGAIGSFLSQNAFAPAFGGRGGTPFVAGPLAGAADPRLAAYAAYLPGGPFSQPLGALPGMPFGNGASPGAGMPFGIGLPGFGPSIW